MTGNEDKLNIFVRQKKSGKLLSGLFLRVVDENLLPLREHVQVELREDRNVGQHHHHHDQVEVEREVPAVRELQSEHLGLSDSENKGKLYLYGSRA